MSLGNVINQASVELYNVSGTCFIKVYNNTSSILSLFLSHFFSLRTNLPLFKLLLHVHVQSYQAC